MKRLSYFLINALFFLPFSTFGQPKPVYPNYNLVSSNSTFTLTWNESLGAEKYEVQISSDSLFTQIIKDTSGVLINQLFFQTASSDSIIFWRVRSTDFSGNVSNWSSTGKFTLLNLNNINGLEQWLKPEGTFQLTSGGLIQNWRDSGLKGNNASQSVVSSMPSLIADSTNPTGVSVLFNGQNQYLKFNKRLTNIRNVFWVIKDIYLNDGFPYRPILGDTFEFNFYRDSRAIWSSSIYISDSIKSGITRVNNQMINGQNEDVPSSLSLISLSTTGVVIASNFSKDRTYTLGWSGTINELIILSSKLNKNQFLTIEKYLNDKYSPPINLGPNKILLSGSSGKLSLPSYYNKINWSTGDTTKTIYPDSSGQYTVSANCAFGNKYYDTISILVQNKFIINDTFHLCNNLPVTVDTKLHSSDFKFIWLCLPKNSKNWIVANSFPFKDSIMTFSTTGTYFLYTVHKSTGCSRLDTFYVSNDNFPQIVLVNDTSICQGNIFKVYAGSNSIKSYLWNNIATTSSFAAVNSGTYSLQTINQNNCINNTFFNVTITGNAPVVDFTSSLPLDTGCVRIPITFYNSSTLPSGVALTKFNWDFGNGKSNNTGWNMDTISYSSFGQYFVTLSIVGNNGCSNFQTQKISILNSPSANFSITTAKPYCQKNPINFSNNSLTNNIGVPITNYAWDFGNSAAGFINTSTNPNGSFSYANSGIYSVKLTVNNKYFCKNSISQTITISGSPAVNFTFNNGCLGTPITFSDSSIQAPGTSLYGYFWTFGNGSSTINPTNTVTYTKAGNYPISLTVTNNLGCSNTTYKTVSIKNAPIPGFYTGPACFQRLVQFYDSSKVIGDTITSWQWQFSSSLTSTSQNPQVVLGDSGNYAVNLTVATKSCSVQTSRPISVKVNSLPPVSFSANPTFGSPPLTVTLTSSLTGISKWKWGLGNGTLTSISVPPLAVVYSDSGTFKVQLTATNLYGCTDSISKSIIVSKPKIDLEVNNVGIVTTNGNQAFSVALYNRGNIPLPGITLYLESVNGFELIENTSITLSVGGFYNYTFSSLIPANTNLHPYFCVEAYPINLTDGNPSNNISCKILSGSFYAGLPFPNPSDSYIEVPITVSLAGTVSITLTDVAGKQFDSNVTSLVNNGYSAVKIQTSSLAAGVYLLYITYKDQIVVQKFVKN